MAYSDTDKCQNLYSFLAAGIQENVGIDNWAALKAYVLSLDSDTKLKIKDEIDARITQVDLDRANLVAFRAEMLE